MGPVASLLAAAGALVALAAPAGGPEQVLEPGQERAAARLVGLDEPDLGAGVRLLGATLDRDRVRVGLDVAGRREEALLLPPDAGPPGALPTPSAALVLPPDLPAAARDALVARLRAGPPALRWRRLVAARDADAARAEAAALAARVEARLGGRAAPPAPPPAPPVAAAVAALARGAADDARAAVAPALAGPDRPPAGALSAWLASRPPPGASPCGAAATCPAAEALEALRAHRAEALDLAAWAGEPTLLARAARDLAARGRPALAAGLLWQALAAPLHDGEAAALARAWGWSAAPAAGVDLPAPAAPPAPPRASGVAWALLTFGALFLAALLAAGRGDRAALAAGALGLAAAVAVALAVAEPPRAAPPAPPSPDARLLALGRGGPCELAAPLITPSRWEVLARCPGGAVTSRVRGALEPAALVVSPLGRLDLPDGARPWLRGLERDLAALAADGLALAPLPPDLADGGRPGWRARAAQQAPAQRAWLALGGPVVALAAAALALLALLAARALAALGRRDRRLGAALAALGLAALAAHALAPARLVMVYTGYAQTHELLLWSPLRYGPGATWLYAPWLDLLGADHATVQAVNRVYGALTLLLLAALAGRLAPGRPRAAAAALLLAGLAPLLWRDHASESILVGGFLLLVAALYALAASRERPALAVLAVPCATAAALTRPELALAAPLLGALVLAQVRPRWRLAHALALAAAVLAAVAVLVPHARFALATVDRLVDHDALPGLAGLGRRVLGDLTALRGLRVAVDHGPAALLALLPLALLARGQRLLSAGLVLVALAWMAFTRVDLPDVSIPRVHAPPWTLLALAGAFGLAWAWEAAARLPRPGPPLARAALLAAWLGSAALTVPGLYRPTNADTEEALVREAARLLPAGRVCLASVDHRDPPPPGKTHRFFPYYVFTEARPRAVLTNLSGLGDALSACPDGAWALLGMRCYMHLREGAAAGPPPPDATPIEACRAFRARWRLEPALERDAVNHGDLAFPMYPAGDRLRVGLYRVLGPAAP